MELFPRNMIRRLVVIAALSLLATACGGSSASNADVEASSDSAVAAEPVTSSSAPSQEPETETTQPPEPTTTTTEATPAETVPADPDIEVLQQFLQAYRNGDAAQIISLLDEEFANQILFPGVSNAGWHSWWSRYNYEGETLACERQEETVSCSEITSSDVIRKVGLTNNMTTRATVVDGNIVQLIEEHRLGSWWAGFFAYLASTYPDVKACTGESSAEPPTIPGIPSDEWIAECHEFMLAEVEGYVANPDYLPPAEVE